MLKKTITITLLTAILCASQGTLNAGMLTAFKTFYNKPDAGGLQAAYAEIDGQAIAATSAAGKGVLLLQPRQISGLAKYLPTNFIANPKLRKVCGLFCLAFSVGIGESEKGLFPRKWSEFRTLIGI